MIPVQPLWAILLLALLLGAVIGSFLATLLVRWPEGRGAYTGRSRCDSCNVVIRPWQLVPILSYFALKGRCRNCGAAIDRRHVAVELAAALIASIAVVAHPLPLALATALFGWWLLLLAALDVEHQWLPDRLTLPLIPLGLIVAWLGFGPSIEERAVGAVVGFLALAIIAWLYRLYRGRDGLGGGDPKMLAGIGAWTGALSLPYILLGAGLIGLAAVALMALRGETVSATSRLPLGSLMALTAWPVWLIAA